MLAAEGVHRPVRLLRQAEPDPLYGTRPLHRAAQFAPFAALTGHKEAIQEAQRLIDQRKVLDENRNMQNDESLQEILQHITEQPRIRVTYFQPDERKDGGAYRTLIMNLKKMDEYNRRLIFSDHSWIPLEDIYEIELLLER